jgi:site-specific DNA-methyltransferase (adenine-specific)
MWLYGSGFPKSLDVSKAIDKASGAERERVPYSGGIASGQANYGGAGTTHTGTKVGDNAISEAAKKWQGWGTALKPAVEPIVLARKPLIGTVAENVLTHGTGALNIDASRISTNGESLNGGTPEGTSNNVLGLGLGVSSGKSQMLNGRWPANILLDEEAAAMLDEQSGVSASPAPYRNTDSSSQSVFGVGGVSHDREFGDSGGASRFFYVAKASRSERNAGLDGLQAKEIGAKGNGLARSCDLCGVSVLQGCQCEGRTFSNPMRVNHHPTVKPVALMKYLIRLVVPKGGVVLDPFLGSGTTAVAAIEEGVEWIGCEREPEYLEIIEARVAAAQPGMGLTLD